MGEGSKPELVTVTPLIRGTGNQGGPTVSSGRVHGGGNNSITIELPVIIDNRVFCRAVKKVSLEDNKRKK
jgi:hypothetical protein